MDVLDDDALEALYLEDRPLFVPSGRFRGSVLSRLDTPGARDPIHRATQWVGFEWLSWGIDFDACRWTFARPGAEPWFRIGRFEPRIEPSRWRGTSTVGLHYEPSRLPGPIRARLYDEIKPLDADTCLGLGGVNAGPGVGDHFWFLLERQA